MVASPSILEPVQAADLRIFPLWGIVSGPEPSCACPAGATCKDVGKHPMVRWRDYDENERGPSGGYGIPTGVRNGIFVVDLDLRPAKGDQPAKNGMAAFLALADGREVPDTTHVLTPSGGIHLYFRLPAGLYVPNKRGLVEGVDVRGEGGYVVGPGSPHKSGGTYQEVPGELADPPPWLLELVVKPVTPVETSVAKHATIEPTSPEGVRAIAWAKSYLSERAEPSIEGQDGSGRLYKVACHLMYSSLPLDTLQELVEEVYNPRCEPPWSQREIEHKISDADTNFEEPRGLCSPDFLLRLAGRTADTSARVSDPEHEYTFAPGMRGSTDTRKASFGEVSGDLYDHASWAGVWAYDSFRDIVIAVNPPMQLEAETDGLTDNDVQLVRAWLEYYGKKLYKDDVRAAIEIVARRNPFDPRIDWLRSIKWDGACRLDRVLPDYFQTRDSEYERGIGPRWFISLVARAMTPGCQSDCTLILEGPQGIGKTSAFRALMHKPEWYADTSAGVEDKDFKQNLLGIWLMAFDELDSLTRSSLTKVKTELTATRDHYRKSFGRCAKGFLRTVGFCGSTNTETYFNDPTGSRRYWPAKVLRQIDVARIIADRDQLWAEAYSRWQAGEQWHVNQVRLRELCEEEQEERLAPDAWEEPIKKWLNSDRISFEPVPKTEENTEKTPGLFRFSPKVYDASQGVTTGDVLSIVIERPKERQTGGDVQRVAAILRKLGMERARKRTGEKEGNSGKRSLEWRYVFSTT